VPRDSDPSQPIRKVPDVHCTHLAQQDRGNDTLDIQNVQGENHEGATEPQDAGIPRSPSPPNTQESVPLVLDAPARRRTPRTRRPPSTRVADVFGEIVPLQPRRRGNNTQSSTNDGAFSAMSAVALKALTSSNTLRNQKYVTTKLETEVIRKPGDRPESPSVKVKTILQRQRDEKGKGRKERANRRARRNEDGTTEGQSDTEGQTGDSSVVDIDSDIDEHGNSPLRKRHKRGTGDEEDYETPFKQRVGEDGAEKRRVKWDRGLFTTVYLDSVKLGTRRPPKENVVTKGCLAATAKAVPLDTLGNIPNADSPLTEVVPESVVVKKFVYDNDVAPVEQVLVVKNTRLRSKKGKVEGR